MKVLVISDIHGASEKLKIVLDFATNENIDKIIVLGDIFNNYYELTVASKEISTLFNKEKVLGKDNWRDSTIFNILQNEIYKGDFVHGKRTKHPTYYENVVEPIISKVMWEECQFQKRNNSKNNRNK